MTEKPNAPTSPEAPPVPQTPPPPNHQPAPPAQEPTQAPAPDPVPEKPIGAIAGEHQPSGLLHTPSPAQLAAFPPPPPMEPAPGVFPLASPEQMQRPQPTFIEDKEPAPRAPKTFAELSDKTQHEVRAGWERSHPGQTFDESTWVEPHIVSAREKLGEAEMAKRATGPAHDRFDGDQKPPPINEKTRAEMEAGRLAVERRNADSRKVQAAVAESNARRLEQGDQPQPDDMGYNAGRQ